MLVTEDLEESAHLRVAPERAREMTMNECFSWVSVLQQNIKNVTSQFQCGI